MNNTVLNVNMRYGNRRPLNRKPEPLSPLLIRYMHIMDAQKPEDQKMGAALVFFSFFTPWYRIFLFPGKSLTFAIFLAKIK